QIAAKLLIDLQTTDLGEVIALGFVEKIFKDTFRALRRGRIARPKSLVDLEPRLVPIAQLIRGEGIAQIAPHVLVVIDKQYGERKDVSRAKPFNDLVGQL